MRLLQLRDVVGQSGRSAATAIEENVRRRLESAFQPCADAMQARMVVHSRHAVEMEPGDGSDE